MRMAANSVWRQEDESLIRDYEFEDHDWNNVRLTLTTHDEGGLTENDDRMAQRIDGR